MFGNYLSAMLFVLSSLDFDYTKVSKFKLTNTFIYLIFSSFEIPLTIPKTVPMNIPAVKNSEVNANIHGFLS